jgi:hypothetical protein
MATFDCVDFGGDLNSGQSVFYITDSFGSRVQLSQEEVGQLISWLQSFLALLPSLALDDKNQGQRDKPRGGIDAGDAEAQARQDWSNDE